MFSISRPNFRQNLLSLKEEESTSFVHSRVVSEVLFSGYTDTRMSNYPTNLDPFISTEEVEVTYLPPRYIQTETDPSPTPQTLTSRGRRERDQRVWIKSVTSSLCVGWGTEASVVTWGVKDGERCHELLYGITTV